MDPTPTPTTMPASDGERVVHAEYIRESATKVTVKIANVQASARMMLWVNLDVSNNTSPAYTATDAAGCPDG